MTQAQLPDGTILEFPDETPIEVIQNTVRNQLGVGQQAPVAPIPTQGVTVEDFLTGATKGAAGLVSLPGELHELAGTTGQFLGKGLRKVTGREPIPEGVEVPTGPIPSPLELLPTYEQTHNFLTTRLGLPDKEAKTRAQKYTQTLTEFIAGNPSRKAVTVVGNIVSGLTSEIAGQLTEGAEKEGVARVIGAITGAIFGEKGARRLEQVLRKTPAEKRFPAKAIAKRVKDLTPEEFARAEAIQRQAQEIGVPLTGAEAIESKPLQELAGAVATSPEGGAIFEAATRGRPAQVTQAVGRELEQVAPPIAPLTMAQKAQEAATQVIKNAEARRSQLSGAYYQALDNIEFPKTVMAPVYKKLDTIIAESPIKSLRDKSEEIKSALKFVTDKKGNINAGKLDSIRKEYRDQIKTQQFGEKAITKTSAKELGEVLGEIKAVLSKNESFSQGRSIYEKISQEVIDPLLAGEIGVVAGKGFDAQTIPKLQRAQSVLSDWKSARPDTIRNLSSELKKVDPEAFPSMVRVLLENNLSKASAEALEGQIHTVGAKFRKEIFGNNQQKRNLRAMMQGVAESRGLPRDSIWNGFNTTLEVMERTGRIPAIGSRTQPRQAVREGARETKVGAALDITQGSVVGGISRAIRNFTEAGNYKKLARIFTSPDSVQIIKNINQAVKQRNRDRLRFLVGQMLMTTRESQQNVQPQQ